MMKDPAFVAEMKKYTESPAFKQAMSRTQNEIEVSISARVCV
jgi:hypothetical protein